MARPASLSGPLLALLLSACGSSDGAASGAEAPPPAASRPAASTTAGSIDIAISGQTINRNSRGDADSVQCLLSFTATNNSAVGIKSLLVNYDALRISTGETIKTGWQIVIPMAMKAGGTGKPFGSEPMDDVRCDDLKLRFGPQPGYQCRTEGKQRCAAFRYRAEIVTVEETR